MNIQITYEIPNNGFIPKHEIRSPQEPNWDMDADGNEIEEEQKFPLKPFGRYWNNKNGLIPLSDIDNNSIYRH